MKRIRTTPRSNWQQTVESQGFHFHSIDEQPYWDESVYYQFSSNEIDAIEAATYGLNEMCLKAVQHVIDSNRLDEFQIPRALHDWVKESWDRDEITIVGRFDLAYDGVRPPRLLEYNADTPTSLLEAAVVQWYWLQDTHKDADQFNSIHERLIEAWKRYAQVGARQITFTALAGHIEDYMTVSYLRDTAMQAGFQTQYINIERIGWDSQARCYVDEAGHPISDCFKLYPWEWMAREKFGSRLTLNTVRWLEAPWKMILSNKSILPVLWELFPRSPFLVPASFKPLPGDYVRKPMLGREGANVELVINGQSMLQTLGIYKGPFIYQQYIPIPSFDGNYPVLGSWMVNGYACGMGIREDVSPVTQNTSRFVPHLFTR